MDGMDGMAPGPLKPRLLALVGQGLAEQQAFIAQLSDAERAARGEPDAWAAKAHIAPDAAGKADARGEVAASVRQEVVDTARRFIGETEEFGYIVYNLGCFYAQTGQPGLALATIRESFASAPSLREGVREDPELVSLRDDPAFQALVADAAEGG